MFATVWDKTLRKKYCVKKTDFVRLGAHMIALPAVVEASLLQQQPQNESVTEKANKVAVKVDTLASKYEHLTSLVVDIIESFDKVTKHLSMSFRWRRAASTKTAFVDTP